MKRATATNLDTVYIYIYIRALLKLEKSNRKTRSNNSGITLIALVITIIVLLILAGMSIAILTGQNGILTQAQTAKLTTAESTENEKRQLLQVEASTHLENYDYTDSEGNTAKIPAGFTVSNVEGENLVSKGIVIVGSTGNEYVWIPCTTDENNTSKLHYKRITDEFPVENDPDDNPTLATKDELTLSGSPISEYEASIGITQSIFNDIVTQIKNEFKSIEKNGGYYISRYEVGNENNIAVIKQNQNAYTNINWTQMYQKAKNINVGTHSDSYLCSSYAWDTAIKFIEAHSIAIDYGSSRNNFNENWSDKEVRDKSGKIIKEINAELILKTRFDNT